MKLLEEKIVNDGVIKSGNVLKVDSFLNHQIDVPFVAELGKELKRLFADRNITKILTIEASGIGIACVAAMYFGVPVVFAKKSSGSNMDKDVYFTQIYSYTHSKTNDVVVSKRFLSKTDHVLIIDDFLASGEAALGMAKLILQAQCRVAGIGIVIEKSFQKGRGRLEEAGYRVESLARIAKFENGRPVFVEEEKL